MNYTSLVGHIVELCDQIDTLNQPADNLTSTFLKARKYLGSHDRRYITSIVFGILRNRRLIEALLEQYLLENPSHEFLNEPAKRYLPLIAAHLKVIDKLTDECVNEVLSTRWKTTFGHNELVGYSKWMEGHADMRFLPDDRHIQLAVKYSFQDWMIDRLSAEYGGDFESLLQALNTPAKTTLRVNTLKCSRDECVAQLLSEGIEAEQTRYSPVGIMLPKRFNKDASKAFKEGWFEIQDEGSQIVSLLSGVQPGMTVIDACAGTGGKALHLAELMRNEGELIAIDIDEKRLYELQTRAKRAGVTNIRVILKDSLNKEDFLGKADIVLIDAPCSGSGTIRRNPGLKWRLTESLISHYATMQEEILAFNAPFVRNGGKLFYVTCSLFREENERVMEMFLKAQPEFSALDLTSEGKKLGVPCEGTFVKLSPHTMKTDGFFVGGMEKT